MERDYKTCRCGSGLFSEIRYDGHGIYLTQACDKCWPEEQKKYNPVILGYYTQEDVDEPIEEDY